jgi:multidrug efflux pump subunit AcrB
MTAPTWRLRGANVQDPMSRVPAWGDQLFGAQYAMRIWLDPASSTSTS